MIKISAGSALENGVMLSTKKYYAVARYSKNSKMDTNGKIELEHEREPEVTSGKIEQPFGSKILNHIPIIGSIIILFVAIFSKNDREPWKTVRNIHNVSTVTRVGDFLLGGLGYSVLAGFSYLVGSNVADLFSIVEGTFWYGFLISLMISLVPTCFILLSAHFLESDMLYFHGAEHKVGNALRKGLPLTPKVIAAQSKHHPNCSTNLVINSCIIFPFMIAFLYAWIGSFVFALITGIFVGCVINMELLRISSWVGNSFLGYIFNFFGLIAQRITVREPKERHIKAALAAMNKVLELEESSS